MAEKQTRWGKIEMPAGRELRLKRRHWAIGDLDTRQGIAIVFGDDDSHARLIETGPEMLALVRRYASECIECNGTGFRKTHPAGATGDCFECADIRALIAKVKGEVLPNG